MANLLLTKCNIIGKQYFHVFDMNDNSVQKVATDQATYQALGQPNPTNPTITNGVWRYSVETALYDTASGLLEDGYYADNTVNYIVKLPGEATPRYLLKTLIVGNVLNTTVLPPAFIPKTTIVI